MVEPVHSYGPTCIYYEDETDTNQSQGNDPPKVKAQFFYVSSLPIDDPLSPLPPISADQATNVPPQPFSVRDTAALEEAWQGFQKSDELGGKTKPKSKTKGIKDVFSFPKFRDGSGLQSRNASKRLAVPTSTGHSQSLPKREGPTAASELIKSSARLANSLGKSSPLRDNEKTRKIIPNQDAQVMLQQPESHPCGTQILEDESECLDPDHQSEVLEISSRKRFFSSHRRKGKDGSNSRDSSLTRDGSRIESMSYSASPNVNTLDTNMSGRPFARAPSGRQLATVNADGASEAFTTSEASDDESDMIAPQLQNLSRPRGKSKENDLAQVLVPVGVSRLHLVEMPDMMLKPIYWSPINDTSSVIRATWFYKETMLPVPAEVANRLEVGYEYMKPYGESYQEELQACIDNGAAAELKVVYKLWPDERSSSRPGTALTSKAEDQQADNAQDGTETPLPEAAENAAIDPRKRAKRRLFETHSVVYLDQKNAQILRPNLLPNVRQSRRPLNSLRKGRQLGVAVVRGFDRKVWLKLHPSPKVNSTVAHAKVGAYMSQSGDAATRNRRSTCKACESEVKTPKVTDLVLVIHGIGQKLSERVDSFHFTHAINGLRRDFNVELSTEAVRGNLRPEAGIMVLPINWRLTVSFDESDKSSEGITTTNKFALQDITPDSIHAVRSMISDVMLDIPYYLSHHKDKMTSAVIREANRVYRLWCRNNPGFQENGRVHLIAHSLGSVMAMEILSNQPTRVPKNLKLDSSEPGAKMFEFDTANLFCVGSPSGFFLLLNGSNLIPRKGRTKSGMEGEDREEGVAGEQGQYGCLAVDNIYNVVNRNDPIAYLQNASVDSAYASSLEPAFVPSASVGFLTRMGNTLRWTSSSMNDAYSSVAVSTRPPIQQMPSTVELAAHNFTREEIAEKRMFLLNDNGQIDFFLNAGGGPLELQYLNMLSAHSSYWLLQDFARFLVVEIGRKPGKENALTALRAVKKRDFKRGSI